MVPLAVPKDIIPEQACGLTRPAHAVRYHEPGRLWRLATPGNRGAPPREVDVKQPLPRGRGSPKRAPETSSGVPEGSPGIWSREVSRTGSPGSGGSLLGP